MSQDDIFLPKWNQYIMFLSPENDKVLQLIVEATIERESMKSRKTPFSSLITYGVAKYFQSSYRCIWSFWSFLRLLKLLAVLFIWVYYRYLFFLSPVIQLGTLKAFFRENYTIFYEKYLFKTNKKFIDDWNIFYGNNGKKRT